MMNYIQRNKRNYGNKTTEWQRKYLWSQKDMFIKSNFQFTQNLENVLAKDLNYKKF